MRLASRLRIGYAEVTWAQHRRQHLLYPGGIARARDVSPCAAGREEVLPPKIPHSVCDTDVAPAALRPHPSRVGFRSALGDHVEADPLSRIRFPVTRFSGLPADPSFVRAS
jgi:hypothetical protein